MMSSPSQKTLTKGSLNEIIGTFFIALASFGLADGGFKGALVVGGAYALFSWHWGDGGYNPAWTAAKMNKDNLVGGLIQIVAQVVGAALAAICASFLGGSTPSVSGGGDMSTMLTDAFITLFVLFSYWKTRSHTPDGFDLGFAYFAALSALPSQFGANASVLLGVVVGNAALGNGLDLGAGTIYGALIPLVVGVAFPFVVGHLDKIPRGSELLGTFVFSLVALSIGEGEGGSLLAVGAALHTAHTNFNGNFNPTVTIGRLVARGDYSTWADPLLDIVAQVVGATLAAIALSFSGDGASVAPGSSVDASATIEVLFAFALTCAYLSRDASDTFSLGLAYFAVASLCSSSFNSALNLGGYLGGLLGFGDGDATLNLLFPIVGAAIAGSQLFAKAQIPSAALNACLLYIGAGAAGTDLLAFGAFVVTLDMIGGAPNPALTIVNGTGSANLTTIGYQLLGGVVGAILVGLVGGSTADVGDGNGLGQSVVAELAIVAIYLRLSGTRLTGLSYYATLAIFGAAAGSIANPITAFGSYVGGGLGGFIDGSGGGFDTSNDALISLASHTLAPLLGGFAASKGYDVFWPRDKLAKIDLKGFSVEELYGSMLFVLASFATSGLDYALVLLALFSSSSVIKRSSADILPALSAANSFGSGADAVGFAYKLVAQTVGAVLAALIGGWLLGDAADAGNTSGDLASLLGNGIVLGLLLQWAFQTTTSSALELVLAFNAATALLSGVAYNGAASLGLALLAGDFGFATDASWWAAFAAPLVGAVLGVHLPKMLNRL